MSNPFPIPPPKSGDVPQRSPMEQVPLTSLLFDLAQRFGQPTHVRVSYTVDDVYVEIAMQRIPKSTDDEEE